MHTFLKRKCEHPLAHAIFRKMAEEEAIQTKEEAKKSLTDMFSGNGLTGEIGGDKFFGGNLKFCRRKNCYFGSGKKAGGKFLHQKEKITVIFRKE